MTFLDALAAAALIAWASYRVWAFIALDEITRPIRVHLIRGKWLRLWLMCPWCAGSWITAAITIAVDLIVSGGLKAPVLVGCAAAAGTALLGGNDDRLMAAESETN